MHVVQSDSHWRAEIAATNIGFNDCKKHTQESDMHKEKPGSYTYVSVVHLTLC